MAGPTIEFLGALPNSEIEELYASSRAFVFPGIEDFGITPLEAMASGLPVIAFGAAGALETVVDGETGIFFGRQSVEALMEAVLRLERDEVHFNEQKLRARAAEFSKARFQERFLAAVEEARLRVCVASQPPDTTCGSLGRLAPNPLPKNIGWDAAGGIG